MYRKVLFVPVDPDRPGYEQGRYDITVKPRTNSRYRLPRTPLSVEITDEDLRTLQSTRAMPDGKGQYVELRILNKPNTAAEEWLGQLSAAEKPR